MCASAASSDSDSALTPAGIVGRSAPMMMVFKLIAQAARTDATAETRQRIARTDETRHEVLQLRQFDLQLAFPRARPARKNIEDQLGAIDDGPPDGTLEVSQLRRRQFVVEDDNVDAGLGRGRRQHLDFAFAEKRRRIRLGAFLLHAQDDVRVGGGGKPGEFLECLVGIEMSRRVFEETDQRRSLTHHWKRILARGPTALRRRG